MHAVFPWCYSENLSKALLTTKTLSMHRRKPEVPPKAIALCGRSFSVNGWLTCCGWTAKYIDKPIIVPRVSSPNCWQINEFAFSLRVRNKQHNCFSITCCHVNALAVTWHFWFVQRTKCVMVLRWQIDLRDSWMQIYWFHFLTGITMEAEALKAKALQLLPTFLRDWDLLSQSLSFDGATNPNQFVSMCWKSRIYGTCEVAISRFSEILHSMAGLQWISCFLTKAFPWLLKN